MKGLVIVNKGFEEAAKDNILEIVNVKKDIKENIKENIKEYINHSDSKIQKLQEIFIPRTEMIHYMKKRTTSDNLFG